MYLESSSIVKSTKDLSSQTEAMHGPSLVRTQAIEARSLHHLPARRHSLSQSESVAVASEACAPVAITNNIFYRAPLRLLLRDE
ncbi:hypothetical protein Q7P35_011028 [Cladosporium inversicolor]